MDHPAVIHPPSLPVRLLRTAELVLLAVALGLIGLLAALTAPAVRDAAGRMIATGSEPLPARSPSPHLLARAARGSSFSTSSSWSSAPDRLHWLRRSSGDSLSTGQFSAVQVSRVGRRQGAHPAVARQSISPAQPGRARARLALFLRYGKDRRQSGRRTEAPDRHHHRRPAPPSRMKWADLLAATASRRRRRRPNAGPPRPVRASWDELAALPAHRRPRRTPSRPPRSSPFQPDPAALQLAARHARASRRSTWSTASKAMATVTRLYTGRRGNSEPNSRTLVRAMIAKTVQRKWRCKPPPSSSITPPVRPPPGPAFAAEARRRSPAAPTGARHLTSIEVRLRPSR